MTETLQPTQSMRMTWVPHTPGNWIFHCHFMRHMSRLRTAQLDAPPPHHAPQQTSDTDLMGGLVLGITVRPSSVASDTELRPRRYLDLHIGRRANVFGNEDGYGFVLQQGDVAPAADSVVFHSRR